MFLEDILEESEFEVNANYPNEAYGDLMALVTKHKLNNKTGNAIIKFFNNYSNLASSPLPVSIEQGRKYMDKYEPTKFDISTNLCNKL